MMPNYKEKLTNPLSDQDFKEGMVKGNFVKMPEHQGLIAFLHYSAVRISEALNMKRKDFRLVHDTLYCDIELRLKHSHKTEPIPLPLSAAYVDTIVKSFEGLKPEEKVWPYSRITGWRIVKRVFAYPHYHRLSRITNFFQQGYTIAEVRSWTGLTLKALDYYVGVVAIEKMGKALNNPTVE
jgi:integrase